MGESGGGHLTASLCVLLAQVVIVVINCDGGDAGQDGDDVGDGDLCFVQNHEDIDHLCVMLALVMVVAINCDDCDVLENSDE